MKIDMRYIGWIVILGILTRIVIIYLHHRSTPARALTPASPPTDSKGMKWETPLSPATEDWGNLRLVIRNVFESQHVLEASPWHAPGGDWTFILCSPVDGDFVITIGIENPKINDSTNFAWGKAILATSDSESGSAFLETFAKAYNQSLPPRRNGRPPGIIKMQTAVLGANLGVLPGGGFGGKGNWTATKWFLGGDNLDAEVFFNFNIADRIAELSEKDPDYREDLVNILATSLRDGPLPERTAANDPTVTSEGPVFSDWRKINAENISQPFLDTSSRLYFVQRFPEGPSRLCFVDLNDPNHPHEVAKFGSDISSYRLLDPAGGKILIVERTPQKADQQSSDDPESIWLITDGTAPRQSINGPWGKQGWTLSDPPTSPDGRFVTVTKWSGQGSQRSNDLYCLDRSTGKCVTFSLRLTPLDKVVWQMGAGNPGLTIIAGSSWHKGATMKSFQAEPITGNVVSTTQISNSFDPSIFVSPDGNRKARLKERSQLAIIDGDGREASLDFSDYDKNYAIGDNLEWVAPHYLLFLAARPSFINVDSLKINFPLPEADSTVPVLFSPDFSYVVGQRGTDMFIGKVDDHQ